MGGKPSGAIFLRSRQLDNRSRFGPGKLPDRSPNQQTATQGVRLHLVGMEDKQGIITKTSSPAGVDWYHGFLHNTRNFAQAIILMHKLTIARFSGPPCARRFPIMHWSNRC
nr:unnamed protein product [Callosobruchus analis]